MTINFESESEKLKNMSEKERMQYIINKMTELGAKEDIERYLKKNGFMADDTVTIEM